MRKEVKAWAESKRRARKKNQGILKGEVSLYC